MRLLYLLRGAPASGKSSWVLQNNLQQYTLSTDQIRLLYASPYLNDEGEYSIPQKNDTKVFKLLFELLENRMINGELTIIDATHCSENCFNKYKPLAEK